MKVIFDACVPRPLRRHLPELDVTTSQEMGWAHLPNGRLLAACQSDFDVLLTVDRGIRYQQRTHDYAIGIVIVSVPSNNVRSFLPVLDELREAVTRVRPGELLVVGRKG